MFSERENYILLKDREFGFNVDDRHEVIRTYLEELGHKRSDFKQYTESLPQMSPSVVGGVVAVAKNEQLNIERFVRSAANLEFTKGNGLKQDNFEVLVVVNNSTDETLQAGKYYKDKIRPDMPMYFIQKDFPKPFANLGSARKFGNDLLLTRMMTRDTVLDLPYIEYYLFSLDVDNEIPSNFINATTELFRTTGCDAVGGNLDRFAIGDYIHDGTPNFRWLFKLYELQKQSTRSIIKERPNTHGNASAISAYAYSLVGGLQAFSPGEDTQLREKLEILALQISSLDDKGTMLNDNPRRLLSDPLAFVSVNPVGKYTLAYHPKHFHSANLVNITNGKIPHDIGLYD